MEEFKLRICKHMGIYFAGDASNCHICLQDEIQSLKEKLQESENHLAIEKQRSDCRGSSLIASTKECDSLKEKLGIAVEALKQIVDEVESDQVPLSTFAVFNALNVLSKIAGDEVKK